MIQKTDHISLTHQDCAACWKCVDLCSRQVFSKVKVLWHRHAKISRGQNCTGCMRCVTVCAPSAIRALKTV